LNLTGECVDSAHLNAVQHAVQWDEENELEIRIRCGDARRETHQFYKSVGFDEMKTQYVFEYSNDEWRRSVLSLQVLTVYRINTNRVQIQYEIDRRPQMEAIERIYELADNCQLVLRRPRIGDEGGLINQLKCVDRETKFLAREEGEFSFTLAQERDFIQQCLDDENRFFILAEVDGEIVGTCAAALVSASKRFSHRASMGIALCQSFWRLGIGSKMMNWCIEWCCEKGLEQLELDVVTENTSARSLYEKYGFEVQGTKKHALKYADGSYADEYHMVLFLSK
jgi:RimJ/RimL family protein N-acetyltransferase